MNFLFYNINGHSKRTATIRGTSRDEAIERFHEIYPSEYIWKIEVVTI